MANITNSSLGYDHIEHKEDWNNQNAHNCPACDMCFDFCGDLRNKRAAPTGFKSPKITNWQPQFKMMYTYGATSPGIFKTSALQITDDQGETMVSVPNNIRLKTWNSKIDLGGLIKDSSSLPTLLYLVAKEHNNKKDADAPFSDPVRYPKEKNDYIWEELPECYWLQPHLLNHNSAQFYFQKKVLFTANLKHLHVRRKNKPWIKKKPLSAVAL